MFLRLLFLLICLIPASLLHAQIAYSLDDDHAYITALEKQIDHAVTDSAKAHLSLKLSVLYRLVKDTAKARETRNKGIAMAKPYPFLHAISWYYKAQALYEKMDLPNIEANLMKGDSLLSTMQSPQAFETRAHIWHSWATVQQMKGDEKGALKAYIDKALPYGIKSGNTYLTGNTKKALGIVMMNANQRDKAAKYLKDAASDLATARHDIPVRLETLAEIHITAAENYALADKLKEAEEELKLAFEIIRGQPRSNLFFSYHFAEAVYLDKMKNYTAAVQAANKGIAIATEAGTAFWVNRLRHAVYKALIHDKKYKEAAAELEKLVAVKGVLENDKKLYYKDLYTTYASAGEKEKAFFWSEKYIRLSDSLYDAKFQSEVIALEKKYNDAEDARKILDLQTEQKQSGLDARNHRLLIWLLCAALLLVISILSLLYVLYNGNKKRARQKELDHHRELAELQNLQKLDQAQALIQGGEQERGRLARELHDGLGGMLAAVKMRLSVLQNDNTLNTASGDLDRAIQQLDVSANELRRIARNMMSEALINSDLETAISDLCASFSGSQLQIDFQAINLQKNIPADKQHIIYRIIQELVTNTLRHAGASRVLVQCSQNGNRFYLTVEDDGHGFTPTAKSEGIGLMNTRNRVGYLNGQVEIISGTGNGTVINIEFDVD